MARLDSRPGTYALVMSSSRRRIVQAGRIGKLPVRPGVFIYVGSAFGPGGLVARISRHRQRKKRLRWHVDYLRAVTRLEGVWYSFGRSRRECQWAEVLREMPLATVPLTGFGSSDCTCPSHLYFYEEKPSREAFRRRLRALCPDHKALYRERFGQADQGHACC